MEKSIIFYHTTQNKIKEIDPEFESLMSHPEKWPEEWRTIYYKTYPRMPQVELGSHIQELNFNLFESLEKRVSSRENDFNPKVKITQKEIANLLYYSAGIKNISQNKEGGALTRFYPSGGARYPLEVYFYIMNPISGFEPGLYHYNVKHNTAEFILTDELGRSKINDVFFSVIAKWANTRAGLIVFITSIFWRNQIKYNERGYSMIHIEAGHLAQNLSLVGQALGLKSCNVAGFFSDVVHDLIDIDGVHEAVITSLILGK